MDRHSGRGVARAPSAPPARGAAEMRLLRSAMAVANATTAGRRIWCGRRKEGGCCEKRQDLSARRHRATRGHSVADPRAIARYLETYQAERRRLAKQRVGARSSRPSSPRSRHRRTRRSSCARRRSHAISKSIEGAEGRARTPPGGRWRVPGDRAARPGGRGGDPSAQRRAGDRGDGAAGRTGRRQPLPAADVANGGSGEWDRTTDLRIMIPHFHIVFVDETAVMLRLCRVHPNSARSASANSAPSSPLGNR
jgi:hypothetical protein